MIKTFRRLGKSYSYFSRYREIVRILVKHGFGQYFANTGLYKLLKIRKRRRKSAPASQIINKWERIRIIFEELGPTFIKFGQVMSNRPDLLPKELIYELEKLQSEVPPFAGEKAKEIVEKELETSVEELFDFFELTPIASASVAQVHKAKLRTGEILAVKVQRPDIYKTIAVDLDIMKSLASIIQNNVKELAFLNPVLIVKEFERTILRELDFQKEAVNIRRFRSNFSGDKNVIIPKVYQSLTSKKVLTMEYIDGIKVSSIEKVREAGCDPSLIAKEGALLVLKQVFEHGFFHADPHPGNIMILPDNKICFLDFGIVGVIYPKHKEHFAHIIVGFVRKDPELLTKTILKICGVRAVKNQEDFEFKIFELIDQYSYLSLKEINMGDLLKQMTEIVLDFHLNIPPNIYLLSKALITIEGTGRKLDPSFNMTDQFKPVANKIIRDKFKPKNLIQNYHNIAYELNYFVKEFPSDFREIIENFKTNTFKIDLNHDELEEFLLRSRRSANKITLSLFLGGCMIAVAIMFSMAAPPLWRGFSLPALLGFGFISLFSLILFWVMIKERL